MTDQAKEARNAYRREWNRRNPDKLREYQERYWAKRAAEAQESNREAIVQEITNQDTDKE